MLDLDDPVLDALVTGSPGGRREAARAGNPVKQILQLVLKQAISDGAVCVRFVMDMGQHAIKLQECVLRSAESGMDSAGNADSTGPRLPGERCGAGARVELEHSKAQLLARLRDVVASALPHEWYDMYPVPIALEQPVFAELAEMGSTRIDDSSSAVVAKCAGAKLTLIIQSVSSDTVLVYIGPRM